MTPFLAPTREGQKKNEEGERVRKKAKPDYANAYKILARYSVGGLDKEKEFILHKAIVDAHDSYLFNDCVPRGEGAVGDEVNPNWLALIKFSDCAEAAFDGTLFNKLADIMLDKFDAKAAEWQRRNRNDFDGLCAAYEYVFHQKPACSSVAELFHDMFFTAIISMKTPKYAFDMDQLSKRTLWKINLRWVDGYQPFQIPESREERKTHRERYHGNFQLE